MNEILTWILDIVQGVDPVLRTALAGIAMMLETSVLVGLVVPGDTIVIVASTAVGNPVLYLSLVGTVILGALTGESIGFALGRKFGPYIESSWVGKRIGPANWSRARTYLARRGGIAVFVSRFLPVLHSVIPLTVGMSTMRYRRFIAWTAPACIIWAFGYATAGSLAAGSYRELSAELHFAGYIFVGIIVAFALLMFAVKKLLHRSESRHMDPEEVPSSVGSRQ